MRLTHHLTHPPCGKNDRLSPWRSLAIGAVFLLLVVVEISLGPLGLPGFLRVLPAAIGGTLGTCLALAAFILPFALSPRQLLLFFCGLALWPAFLFVRHYTSPYFQARNNADFDLIITSAWLSLSAYVCLVIIIRLFAHGFRRVQLGNRAARRETC